MKNKQFDCVEMKRNIQNKLMQEYEARKCEFTSYAEFINKTLDESEEIRAFRQRVDKAQNSRRMK